MWHVSCAKIFQVFSLRFSSPTLNSVQLYFVERREKEASTVCMCVYVCGHVCFFTTHKIHVHYIQHLDILIYPYISHTLCELQACNVKAHWKCYIWVSKIINQTCPIVSYTLTPAPVSLSYTIDQQYTLWIEHVVSYFPAFHLLLLCTCENNQYESTKMQTLSAYCAASWRGVMSPVRRRGTCMRVFPHSEKWPTKNSHTIREVLDPRNRKKCPQVFWPLSPVEYVTLISGRIDAP